MKRIILFLLLVLFLCSDSFAQFSIKGGMNWSKLNPGSSSVFFNGVENRRGVLLGVSNKFNLSDFVSFRPGLQYVSKGSRVGFSSSNVFNEFGYLEAPLDIVYTIGGLSLHTGTYVSYLMTATRDDQNIKESLAPIDMGINIGLGLSFHDFGIGINYGLGLVNISKDEIGNPIIKNKTVSIYLTYTQY